MDPTSIGTSRASQLSGAPKPVMVGGNQPELPMPTSLHPCTGLYLSHQVQVIHVAAAPGLPVCTSARPGYHDNRMQGTRASVGCGSWRGSAKGSGGGLFLPPVGSLARAGASGGLCGPSLPPCFGISFLPSVLGAGGGARVPSLVGGVQKQMGGKNSPSHLGYAPTTPKF